MGQPALKMSSISSSSTIVSCCSGETWNALSLSRTFTRGHDKPGEREAECEAATANPTNNPCHLCTSTSS